MIRFSKGRAALTLPADVYPKESLVAAAATLGGRAEAYLEKSRGAWKIGLVAPKAGREALERLACEFLEEALSHAYRQRVIRFHGALTGPVLSRVFERGFESILNDALEQLEPDVAEARRSDTEELLEAARRLGGKP